MFTDLGERGNERERDRERQRETERQTHWCETGTRIGCRLCVPPPGIEPTTFWCTGRCSNQFSHLAGARCLSFFKRIVTIMFYMQFVLECSPAAPANTCLSLRSFRDREELGHRSLAALHRGSFRFTFPLSHIITLNKRSWETQVCLPFITWSAVSLVWAHNWEDNSGLILPRLNSHSVLE